VLVQLIAVASRVEMPPRNDASTAAEPWFTPVSCELDRARKLDPLAPRYIWILAKPYLSTITLGSCSIVTMRPLLPVGLSSHPKHHSNVFTIRHLQVPLCPCKLFLRDAATLFS
jgi:hypothetical protein